MRRPAGLENASIDLMTGRVDVSAKTGRAAVGVIVAVGGKID
jgi:hypothetical protein